MDDRLRPMGDDSTAGHWEPLADQPIVPPPPEPEPSRDTAPARDAAPARDTAPQRDAAPPEPPNRSPWAPPAYGPPPSEPTYAAPPRPTYAAPPRSGPPPYAGPPGFPPPDNVWASPDTAYAGYGDYVESPARRRRSPRLVISSVVVLVLVVVGSGVALFANSSHSQSSSSPLPSQAAHPHPLPSAQEPSPSEGSATPPSGNTAAAGPLDDYLLAPTDIGAVARMMLFPNGRGLDGEFGATLDFCNYHYTTEPLRKTRVQVTYLGGAQQVSNEFVRYQPGGAEKAFAELKKAVSGCPSSFQESDGTASNIEQAPTIKSLVANHLTLTFAVTTNGLGGQQTLWTTAMYQFDGDFFSGVYVYGANKASVEQFAASLGSKAAKHIMEAAQGKPGTGGGPITQQGGAPQQPGVPAAFR